MRFKKSCDRSAATTRRGTQQTCVIKIAGCANWCTALAIAYAKVLN